jgi:uncharacterized membrane protein
MDDKSESARQQEQAEETQKPILVHPIKAGLVPRLRTYFFTGIIVVAPVSITLYLAWLFIDFVDRNVNPLIPARYNPETYLPFSVPGLGLLVMVVMLTFIGALTANFMGRLLFRMGERIVDRVPVIRNVYGALKQIFETVLRQSSTSFRQVVLVEYPRRGIWAIAFITGTTEGEVQNDTEDQLINIFLPTTPNPTSGFLLFVPKQDLVHLSMTVEEGIKMVISGGIVTPPDTRPAEVQAAPVVPSRTPEEERELSDGPRPLNRTVGT